MLGLSDRQLQIVLAEAALVPVEKRSLFLRRLAAMCRLRGDRFGDSDVAGFVRLAAVGLIHAASRARADDKQEATPP